MVLEYTETALEAFIAANLGDVALTRFRPKVDRLIALYVQFGNLRYWLNENVHEIGSKDYKEQVVALNSMMQNIRNLEEDVGLYVEKKQEMAANPLTARMLLKKEDKHD